MAEPQLKFSIGANDNSRAAWASFTGSVTRAQASLMSMSATGETAFNRFSAPLRRAQAELSGFAGSVRSMAAAFGVTIGAAAIKRAIADLGDLKDAAERAGVSIRDIQTLGFAARQSGGGFGDIVDLFQKLNRGLAEAKTSGNDLGEILKANNIPLTDANGILVDNKQQFYAIVDLITNAKTEQEKNAVAMSAFGRSAADMLPLLRQGSDAIRKSEQAAVDAGLAIDENIVKQADELDEKFNLLWERFTTAGKRAAVTVAGALDAVFDPQLPARSPVIARIGNEELLKQQATEAARVIDEIARKREELSRTIQQNPEFTGQANDLFGPEIKALEGKLAAIRSAMLGNLDIARNPFDQQYAQHSYKPTVVPNSQQDKAAADASKKLTDDAEKRQKAIDDVIKSLIFEQAQLGRTAKEQEVYNQLQRAGVDISSAYGKSIADLTSHLYDQKQALSDAAEGADQFRNDFKDTFGSVVDMLRDGKVEAKEFGDILASIGSKLLDRGLDNLTDQLFGKQGTPLSGAIGKLLNAGGSPSTASRGGSAVITPEDVFRTDRPPTSQPEKTGKIEYIPAGAGFEPGIDESVVTKAIPGAYAKDFATTGKAFGLPPGLLEAMGWKESGFNPNAVNPKSGATGMMQFMPGTAKDLHLNPWNPQESIWGAGKYMSGFMEKYGDVPTSLAAYNWGPGNVDKFLGRGMTVGNNFERLPDETQDYITKIMGKQKEFAGNGLWGDASGQPLDNTIQKMTKQAETLTEGLGSNIDKIVGSVQRISGVAEQAGSQFGSSFPSGLQAVMEAIQKAAGGGAASPLLKIAGTLFNASFGNLLGPMGRPHGMYAEGGRISGPGSGTSDSIVAAVSNGEYIVNAASTAKHGPLLDAINNDSLKHFAKGGLAGDKGPGRASPSFTEGFSAEMAHSAMTSVRNSSVRNTIHVAGATVHIHGNPDEKTMAIVRRELAANNAVQAKQLRNNIGDINTQYQSMKGM